MKKISIFGVCALLLSFFSLTHAQVCGNGIVETGEACDDGNTLDGDYCSSNCTMITGSCGDGVLQTNELCDPLLHACCNQTTCNSTLAVGTVCRNATSICDVEETCQGNITCPLDTFQNSTILCRNSTGVCDVEEYCSEASADCPTDVFLNSTVLCRNATGGLCDLEEYCSGASADCPVDSFAANGTLCGSSPGQCNDGQFCNGTSPVCPDDIFEPLDTPCTLDGLNCTVDACNGLGTCVQMENNCQCDSNAECTAVQYCFNTTCVNGFCEDILQSGFCFIEGLCIEDGFVNPLNDCLYCNSTQNSTDWTFALEGSACDTGSPEGLCSAQDTCNAMGVCVDMYASNMTLCRNSTGLCDVKEYCSGSGDFCPVDTFEDSSFQCEAPSGPCGKGKFCSGMSASCDGVEEFFNMTIACRNATGLCDQIEYCTGVSSQCPSDMYFPNGTLCRAKMGECDVIEVCNGTSPICPDDAILSAQDMCESFAMNPLVCAEERYCDGMSKNCTAPLVARNTTYQCREPSMESMGCDLGIFCDGVNYTCPSLNDARNSSYQCAPSSGVCSLGRFCSDTYPPLCEEEQFLNSSHVCRPVLTGHLCDLEERCTGDSGMCPPDAKRPNGFICRDATGICDPPEICNGVSKFCPSDQYLPNGTGCPDGIFCNGDEKCMSGICMPAVMNRTCDDMNPCTDNVCDEQSKSCLNPFSPMIGQHCYSGPNGTLGVGICTQGTLQCFPNGTIICLNEVVPAATENCLTFSDDNCNGVMNEGCDGTTCVDDFDCASFVPRPCQTYLCNNTTNMCEYPVADGFCLIESTCYNETDVNPWNPCEQCLPSIHQDCFSANDSLIISDDDVCNGVEVCYHGWPTFSQAPLRCEPQVYSPCVNYTCDSVFGCMMNNLPDGTPCDTGYHCSIEESCVGGFCKCLGTEIPSEGLSRGVVVAIVVGTVALVALLALLCVLFPMRPAFAERIYVLNDEKPRGSGRDYRESGEKVLTRRML